MNDLIANFYNSIDVTHIDYNVKISRKSSLFREINSVLDNANSNEQILNHKDSKVLNDIIDLIHYGTKGSLDFTKLDFNHLRANELVYVKLHYLYSLISTIIAETENVALMSTVFNTDNNTVLTSKKFSTFVELEKKLSEILEVYACEVTSVYPNVNYIISEKRNNKNLYVVAELFGEFVDNLVEELSYNDKIKALRVEVVNSFLKELNKI